MSLEKYTCLYRVLPEKEECRTCLINYNPHDPMSNLYCPSYRPATRMFGSVCAIVDEDIRRNIIEELKALYKR